MLFINLYNEKLCVYYKPCLGNNNKNNECNMRKIKSEFVGAQERNIVVLSDMPQHKSLVKANRLLLLVASSLMLIVLVMGFLLLPADDMLVNFKPKKEAVSEVYAIQNPALTAEINTLKGQLVGLVSGSIESKLRTLEQSIRMGQMNTSLGTIQDLKNDIRVLRSYSEPVKKLRQAPVNEALLQEVSQLKNLIYLTLTSCGLMIAAIGGIWVRNRYRLSHPASIQLGKHK